MEANEVSHKLPSFRVRCPCVEASGRNLLDAFARSDNHLKEWSRALIQETEDIITSKRWWPKVEAVAKALVQRRKMSGKEVTTCIRTVFDREFADAVQRQKQRRK
jgi:hypothetical protein